MKETKRYWDSSCFLGWLKNEVDKVDECRGVIHGCESGQLKIVTSTFTLVEVLYLKNKQKIPKEEARLIRDFFEHRYIITIEVDRRIAEKAQEIFWDYEIKPKDSIHAASALLSGSKILETFDPDFLVLDGKIGNPPIQIKRPHFPYQLEISEKKDSEK